MARDGKGETWGMYTRYEGGEKGVWWGRREHGRPDASSPRSEAWAGTNTSIRQPDRAILVSDLIVVVPGFLTVRLKVEPRDHLRDQRSVGRIGGGEHKLVRHLLSVRLALELGKDCSASG